MVVLIEQADKMTMRLNSSDHFGGKSKYSLRSAIFFFKELWGAERLVVGGHHCNCAICKWHNAMSVYLCGNKLVWH